MKAALYADLIHAFRESSLSRRDWCQQNKILYLGLCSILSRSNIVEHIGHICEKSELDEMRL